MHRTILQAIMQLLLLLASVVALASANPRPDGRIVGGKNATIQDHPHQVSVRRNGSHRCAGSIIDKDWVVTTAYCTDDMSASYLTVRAGSTFMVEGGEEIQVERIFQHPLYNLYTHDNDITLLKLSESLTFSDSVQPIKYVTQRPPDGAKLNVTGWGAIYEDGPSSNVLQVVEVNVVNQGTCEDLYSSWYISDRMICAGVDEQKGFCQGDSGGPLTYNGDLVGIASWGYGCAKPGYPGVYASVADLSGFINGILPLYS